MKTLAFVHSNNTRSAVGDFSPVLSVFSHHELGNTVSPFLLLDYIGPGRLLPTTRQGGVDWHPHRGFETVTLVFSGELEHRDSTGSGGLIGPGDVQWMTAASGIVHKEVFSTGFARQGGRFEMIQLWVNLPAADKMSAPGYQSLTAGMIPVVDLADGAGSARVIAGSLAGVTGPARTHTRMNVFDVRLRAGGTTTLTAAAGDTALVFLMSGRLQLAEADSALEEDSLAVLSSREADITLDALADSHFLVLTGEPLHEPISAHGFFVMNHYDEILQAYEDAKNGRLGSA